MNVSALFVSVLGVIISLTGIAMYFSKLMKNKVPVFPIGLIVSLLLGITSASVAIYLAVPGSVLSVIPVVLLSSISIFMGCFFLWVLSQRKTPVGNIKVRVGESLIPFSVKAANGHNFSTNELMGKRVLLKFYRGSWCPYCSKELTMFDEMKPEFDKYGVQIVALSGDTVEQSKFHAKRDKLSHLLLSDPELNVVKQYGVEHHKAFGADSDNIMTLFGLPFPKPHQLKFKSMSIPTSILVDEHGVIQWIDQSDDYRLRANKDRIMKAMTQHLSMVD